MDTLVVRPKNKESIPFLKQLLKNLNIVESVEVVKSNDNRTHKSIEAGLNDVKEIVAGKKKGKSLRQLLDEV
jgi:hypothetical protein